MIQDNIINTFLLNVSIATDSIHYNTTKPYPIEICKKIIGQYDNLLQLYKLLPEICKNKQIKPIIRLFSVLCFQLINLTVAITENNDKIKKEVIFKINIIQEKIGEIV